MRWRRPSDVAPTKPWHAPAESGRVASAAWSTAPVNLSVQVFIDREDGERDLFDPPTDADGQAGYDSWRETVWGSRRARALGAEILPRLVDGDLYVEPAEVAVFLQECALLRENLEKLVPGMDALDPHAAGYLVNAAVEVRFESGDAAAEFRRTVADRLTNIEAAARYALVISGGVAISTSATPPVGDLEPASAVEVESELESQDPDRVDGPVDRDDRVW